VTRIQHDFTIDVMRRPSDGKQIFVARCLHGGCGWHTGELTTRRKAVLAAWTHQAHEAVKKL